MMPPPYNQVASGKKSHCEHSATGAGRTLRSVLIVLATLIGLSGTALAGPRIVSTGEEDSASQPAQSSGQSSSTTASANGSSNSGGVVVHDQAEPGQRPARRPVRTVQESRRGFEMWFRFGGLFLESDWIDPDGTANLGGFGMLFRWRFHEDFSLDTGFDFTWREAENRFFEEFKYSSYIGVLWYFTPPSWWQLFASSGLQVSTSEVETSLDYGREFSEVGLYAGSGVELSLGDFLMNTEFRGHWMFVDSFDPEAPDTRFGWQWTVGTGWRF